MIKNYIKKAKEKPEHARKRILTIWLIVCMSIVFLIWFYNLGLRFNKSTADKTRDDVKPFKMFGESISSTFDNINNSLDKISPVKDEINKARSLENNQN